MPADLRHRIDAIRNTAEVIAQSIKEMIHTAELKPGQPLIQERIAKMFHVSRVPVRDALQLLILTGVAVSVPRRGVIVRPLSRKSLADLFGVRKILEGAAIRAAAAQATPQHCRRLETLIVQQVECQRSGDVQRYAAMDDEFHRALYEVVENARLQELIFSNWERIKQARCASTVKPEHGRAWIASSVRRHKRIVSALKAGDAERACRMVFETIDSSHREIVECLGELGWIEASVERRGRARSREPRAAM